jgi:peptidoglycan hydrolase-like protein with peptidoglycan-binding domain
VDESDFEFDFFPERRPAAFQEWGKGLGDEEVPDPGRHALPARRRSPSRAVIMRRRIAVASAALLLLVILVVVATQGSSGQGGAYRRYLATLSPIAADSERVGGSLAQVFAGSQGRSAKTGLVAKLDGLVQRAMTDITRLQALTPPAALRSEQEQALAALDLRLYGLHGIRDTVAQALASQNPSAWARVLSAQVDDLVTSDLIWDGSVRGPTVATLQGKTVGPVSAPASRFVADGNLSLVKSMLNLLQPQGTVANGAPLTLGAKGPAVARWQTQLNGWLRLTAPKQKPLTPDGSFGPATQAATMALQTAQGITPDGTVNPSTQRALRLALTSSKQPSASGSTTEATLALGDKGPAVASWQTQLNVWLRLTVPRQKPLTPNGSFGPATQAATKALQTAQGITPDGTVGPRTRRALQLALARPSQTKTG